MCSETTRFPRCLFKKNQQSELSQNWIVATLLIPILDVIWTVLKPFQVLSNLVFIIYFKAL
jgi:hypothetical protein